MPSFFASDLAELLIALLLGIPLILLPGYGLGWLLDLFGFRNLDSGERWSLSPAFGLSFCPILLYLSFRLLHLYAMWTVALLLFALGLFACLRIGFAATISRRFVLAAAVWLLLAAVLTLDVHIGTRLYPSNVIIDTSFRSQVISSLANAQRLPAESYFFYPGHAVPLRYHYLYFLIPSLTVQFTRFHISSAMALLALTMWTGLSMFGLVAAIYRYFWQVPDQRRTTSIAWALLGIGGLDVLFYGSEMIWRASHGMPSIPGPDVGLWNGWGSAFSWLSTALWSPHHIGGLLAGFLGCLLLWHSRNMQGRSRWSHAIAAALAFATLAGTSLYVCLIFAVFLVLVVIELFLNAPRYLPTLLVSGIGAGLLILRFFLDVRPTAGAPAIFSFQVRPFVPITHLFHGLGISSQLAWNFSYIATLPLTYFASFGVFFVGGIWWLRKRREHSPELVFRDHMVIGLGTVSLFIPSFVWSGMEISNDLGYRGVLPAQFLLLLCTAEMLTRARAPQLASHSDRAISSGFPRSLLRFATVLLVLGIGTNLLEAFVLRRGIGTTARDTIQVPEMFRPDTSAERLYALRETYTWIRKNTPRTAVIQENPITWQMAALGQYSERRTVVYGSNPSWMVGDDHREYLETQREVSALFSPGTTESQRAQLCIQLDIDYLLTQPGDPSWNTMSPGSVLHTNHLAQVSRCTTNPIGRSSQ